MTLRKQVNAPRGASDDLASLSQNDVTILAETFRLLGDPSRLRIMLCCMKGSSSVGDIAESLELSQSLVSHHLRLLRSARLVRGERHARQVLYEADDAHVRDMLRDMLDHAGEHA